MSKSLKTIQTISKIAKILSNVVFIFSIIGGAFCVLGIVSLAVGVDTVLKIGGINIIGIIEKEAEMGIAEMYLAMGVGCVFCIFEAILSKFSYLYFKRECEAGTPFTFDGSKELLRLGILSIVLPIVSNIICSSAYKIVSLYYVISKPLQLNGESGVVFGVMLIILSIVFKYGSEILQNKN